VTERVLRARAGEQKGGFTLIELLVVIAIIAILAAILFPVYARLKEKAMQNACLHNVKQFSYAIHLYADDNDGWVIAAHSEATPYPTNYWWYVLQVYVRDWGVIRCPSDTSDPKRVPCSYGWNYPHMSYRFIYSGEAGVKNLSSFQRPSDTMVFADSQSPTNDPQYDWARSYVYCPLNYPVGSVAQAESNNKVGYRHNQGANCAFLDGHARWLSLKQILYDDTASLTKLWGHK